MKNKILVIVFFFLSIQLSYASFVIPPKASPMAESVRKNGLIQKTSTSQSELHGFGAKVRAFRNSIAQAERKIRERSFHINDSHSKPGWPGITSFICAISAIFLLFVGSSAPVIAGSLIILSLLCAVVFGIIGVTHRYKNHGFAIAGLVIGVVGIALVALIIAIVSALAG